MSAPSEAALAASFGAPAPVLPYAGGRGAPVFGAAGPLLGRRPGWEAG